MAVYVRSAHHKVKLCRILLDGRLTQEYSLISHRQTIITVLQQLLLVSLLWLSFSTISHAQELEPLYLLQGHVIRTFDRGVWASLSAGYDWGGQSSVNGEKEDDKRSDFLYAMSVGMPVSKTSSIKAASMCAPAPV